MLYLLQNCCHGLSMKLKIQPSYHIISLAGEKGMSVLVYSQHHTVAMLFPTVLHIPQIN